MDEKENKLQEKYANKAAKFYRKDGHYELVFMDDFVAPSGGGFDGGKEYTLVSELVSDMRHADHRLELHVVVNSYGGDLSALAMLMEAIREFEYTVGICTGYACSAGFMLFATCDELYASPFATFMYHEPASLTYGKMHEIRAQTSHVEKLYKILLDRTSVQDLLTEEELDAGKTTEVYLTGQELIDRGVVNALDDIRSRKALSPVDGNVFMVGKYVYVRKDGEDRYTRFTNSGRKYDYADLLNFNDKETRL